VHVTILIDGVPAVVDEATYVDLVEVPVHATQFVTPYQATVAIVTAVVPPQGRHDPLIKAYPHMQALHVMVVALAATPALQKAEPVVALAI